jgi:tetratricopeptide (TPR) repeat protein
VALDPLHQRSSSELERVIAAYDEQRFNDAMSEGYTALDANQFDKARKAFRRAASVQAGSSEAASALQEVEAAATAYRLASLQSSGTRDEQAEQWQKAVTAYEQAQKIDPNVLFAREGLARSRDRARLDKQFSAAIAEPQRLSDAAVAAATGKMLQMARTISPRGPVLARQIEQLEQLLQQANTPIAVTVRSDLQTDVVVYKVAKLGKFDEHQLDLRPGTYTAVGSRIGYRDVRVDFVVKHGSKPLPVTIACTETI